MSEVILKCENLNKKLSRKQILKNISLEVRAGDIVGFIGPNGAGKTTTIKLILGLQKIDSGKVTINGYDIKKDFKNAIKRVGTIVESPDMYMYLSGLDNLKLVARMYNNIGEKEIQEVVKLVGLENRIKDKVSKYSLGMKQRLGIAQAIMHNPNLLILDEPTNGLDPDGIKDLRELLIKLATEKNIGVLISSHNLAELDNFCTKVCIIKSGEIVENASLNEIKGETIENTYTLDVSHVLGIESIIEHKVEIVDEHTIKIKTLKAVIPDIVEKLTKAGIKVYSVTPEKINLEDIFLRKTGGNTID